MTDLDYQKLGFKCGIEIHQQLDAGKLFCGCPSIIREDEPDYEVKRKMRAVAGEIGDVDPAALYEFLRDRKMQYQGYRDTTCLVELDEEPPHALNQKALDAALEVSLLLNARPVDELQVMRKTVIDGSNTSGFQRTILVAADGHIETEEGRVGIPTVCLEEDAARKIREEGNLTVYRLDRLGIPLVEIATDPDIKSPEHARSVAEKLGMILRATGKVKRGLGTIRQDLNVSIRDGQRIEIKGVQDLRSIADMLRGEIERQVKLLEVKKELASRGAKDEDYSQSTLEVSSQFKDTDSKMIAKTLKEGGGVYAVKLPHMQGLLKNRLGPELAQYARSTAGVKGIFHSDELPGYGITQEEADKVGGMLSLKDNDAFALVAEKKDVAEKALLEVLSRSRLALQGVPKETRKAGLEGKTEFMRPLPGSARMYPETDEPLIPITEERLTALKDTLSELPEERMERYLKLGLGGELAGQLVKSRLGDVFDSFSRQYPGIKPSVIATTLISAPKEAKKRYGADVGGLETEDFEGVFRCLSSGKISGNVVPELLAALAESPGKTAEELAEEKGLKSLSREEIAKLAEKVVGDNRDAAEKMGLNAVGLLTGKVMAAAGGKADAAVVREVLESLLKK